MRFAPRISDEDIIDAIRDLGYVATLPTIMRLISARYNVEDSNPEMKSIVRNQIYRRVNSLAKFRILIRTGQKGDYKYRIEE